MASQAAGRSLSSTPSSMERPHSRRHKAEPCLVPAGDGEGSFDEHEKKERRGYRLFLNGRVTCLHRILQSSSQRHYKIGRLCILIIVGIVGILQLSQNVNIEFFRRAETGTDDFPLIATPLVIPRNVPGATVMKEAAYLIRPRVMGFYFEDASSQSFMGAERLDHLHRPHMTKTTMKVSKRAIEAQLHLRNSRDYNRGRRDDFESGDCKAQYEWQLHSHPSCNSVHEQDLRLFNDGTVKILGNGYWRDVWRVTDFDQKWHVLKTIRYEHDFEDRNYDRHRRDALAMERLTASSNIVDIYSFCGNSGIFEFAPGGDLEDMIWYADEKWNSTEKLIVSYQVASGIADVHDVEKNGRPSIAHTDITTSQFVFSDGRYKLNDFNRCRFIAWNEKKDRQCKFHVGNNPGSFRSPEEYKYEMETEKIDIYSMGNIFYTLLTEKWPFDGQDSEDAQHQVKHGKRPRIPSRFRDSNDPAVRAILMAMTMSWRQDPEERASAREVKDFLRQQLQALNLDSSDQ